MISAEEFKDMLLAECRKSADKAIELSCTSYKKNIEKGADVGSYCSYLAYLQKLSVIYGCYIPQIIRTAWEKANEND